MMVMAGRHAVAAFGCAMICGGGINGLCGGRISFNDNAWWRTAPTPTHHQHRHTNISGQCQCPKTNLAIAKSDDNYAHDAAIDDDDDDDDVVFDESWSKRFTISTPTAARSSSVAPPPVQISQLKDGAAHSPEKAPPASEGRYPLIESWLQSYIPTLSPADCQTYASILANDGFTTIEQLNSINSKSSGRVEDLYFMQKDHRRRLMVELGVLRSRRSRAVGTTPTNGRRSMRPTAANVQLQNDWLASGGGTTSMESRRERPPLDESISLWLAEQSRLVEERARENAATAAADADTTTDTATARSDALLEETTGQSAANSENDTSATQRRWERDNYPSFSSSTLESEGGGSTLDDVSARFSSLDIRAMEEGSNSAELRRLRELRDEFHRITKASTTAATVEDDFILDDLTARYSSLEIKPLDDGSAEKENRRLRELKEAFQRSESASSVAATVEDDVILDDLTARYSSLEIKPLDDGSAKKENRRLRELREAFQRKVEKVEVDDSSYEYYSSTADDFATRYDSLDTTVALNKDGTANKEARRLEELKKAFLSRKAKFKTEILEAEEPLRLDLLKRPSTEETAIERKERMRMKDIQRIARRAAEQKVESAFRRPPKQQQQSRTKATKDSSKLVDSKDEIDRSSTLITKKYKTNGERRLEALQRNFIKGKSNYVRTVPTNPTMRSRLSATPSPSGSERVRYSDTVTRTAREEAILAEMKAILAEMTQKKGRGTLYSRGVKVSTRRSSNDNDHEKGANEQNKECEIDDEECWDITRSPNFYARSSRSLATTLPPISTQMDAATHATGRSTATDTAEFLSSTVDLIKAGSKELIEAILPQEFERESSSMTLLQATPMQQGKLAVELQRTHLDSSDEASQSANASSLSETNVPQKVIEDFDEAVVDDLRQEGEVNISISSPVSPTAQHVGEGMPNVLTEDLKSERPLRASRLISDSSIGTVLKITTDDKLEATDKHDKRASVLHQQIPSDGQEKRALDMEPTPEDPVIKSQIRTHPAPASLSDNDALLDVTSHFPETRPFMTVQTRRQEFRFNTSSRKAAEMEYSNDLDSYIEQVNSDTKKEVFQNIASRFSKDRASFLAFPPRRVLKSAPTTRDRSCPNQPRTPSSDSSSLMNVSQVITSGQQFLDKPRPFQPNLDMVSSNTSGSSFKRTSDLHPEEKNTEREFFDICTRPLPSVDEMAMTKASRILAVAPTSRHNPISRLERSSSIVRDASNMKVGSPNDVITHPTSIDTDGSIQSGEEQVMHWLLTHLPNLPEEDAISYFNSLMKDGFDCNESLNEILAEDLHFMAMEHQLALLRSLRTSNEVTDCDED